MTSDIDAYLAEAELTVWLGILAQPDTELKIGHDEDGPVVILVDNFLGRTSRWLFNPT